MKHLSSVHAPCKRGRRKRRRRRKEERFKGGGEVDGFKTSDERGEKREIRNKEKSERGYEMKI